MAGSRAERISAREQRERDERRERRIVLAGGGVLLVAALVVLAGLVFTQYLPPRARVASIEGASISASTLVDHAVLLVILEPDLTTPPIDEFAAFTIERLIDQTALRVEGAAEFGIPTEQQRAAASRALLDIPEDAEDAVLADARAEVLWSTDVVREFDAIVEARAQEAVLRARVEAEVGESAPQLRLRRIRVSAEVRARELREQALGGADFGVLADGASDEAATEPGGDLGWQLVETIDPPIASALADLAPGEITEPLPVGFVFEIYLLEERDDARALDGAQIEELVEARMGGWLAVARERLEFEHDLSAGESEWVTERFRSRLAARLQSR